MRIETRVLDELLDPIFQAHTEIGARNLIEVAKPARRSPEGPAWTADAISVSVLIQLSTGPN